MADDATQGFRVVFQERDDGEHRRVKIVHNEPDLPHHDDGWDGDEELVLHPKGSGPDAKTLRQTLEEIRNEPRLVLLNLPVVRSLQDTRALWAASKSAMLDTIGSIHEQRCLMLMQQRLDVDDEAVRIRLRETRMQLQTTVGSWREHKKFLDEQCDQLQAGILKSANEAADSRAQLQRRIDGLVGGGRASDRCLAASRVLLNAAQALESTQDERRALIAKRFKLDRTAHGDTLRALNEALNHFCTGFASDLEDIRAGAREAQGLVDASIRQKQVAWHRVCQELRRRYHRDVHVPLQQLLLDLKSNKDKDAPYTEPLPVSIDIAQAGLDDANDPHCLRRCEVAQNELLALKAYLGKLIKVEEQSAASEGDAWDDDAMRAARAARTEEAASAQSEHDQRMLALQDEQRDRKQALQRAKEHMVRLRDRAAQIRDAVTAGWTKMEDDGSPDANRRAVALTRMAQQRQDNLRQEMEQTNELIKRLHGELIDARTKVTASDRHAQVRRYLAVTNSVHQLCRRMRSQFEQAIHAEEMMRRIVRDQFTDSARACHQISTSIVQKVLETARARFGIVRVDLARADDAISEASRRIETLNNARLEQELRVDGPEIGLYTALEEHVVLTNQVHQLRDSQARCKAMSETCHAAMQLLQDLVRALEGV
jgi:hypothetical protein